jgi:hypothetical protein
MKKLFLIASFLLSAATSLDALAASCRFYPPIDGDNSVTENVKGHPGTDSYAYLVKRDLFGDGTNFVVYPIYSKNWLLTSGRLREIVARDHANVIGSMDVPIKIAVIQSPKDANDFKAADEQSACGR